MAKKIRTWGGETFTQGLDGNFHSFWGGKMIKNDVFGGPQRYWCGGYRVTRGSSSWGGSNRWGSHSSNARSQYFPRHRDFSASPAVNFPGFWQPNPFTIVSAIFSAIFGMLGILDPLLNGPKKKGRG